MYKCPICEEEFHPYAEMRKDSKGRFWCKSDQDEHDSVDWEEVYERRESDRGW